MKKKNEKGVCICRNSLCNKKFHESEIKKEDKEILGVHTYELQCPYCNSTSFGLVNYPVPEEKIIYGEKNKKWTNYVSMKLVNSRVY